VKAFKQPADMNAIEKAQRFANLAQDETYKELLADVRESQAAVMLNPAATQDELEEAHAIVRALDKIDDIQRRTRNAAVVEDRKL
jgi:hypothetical protein